MSTIVNDTQVKSVNSALNLLDVAINKLERGDVLKKHTNDLAKLKELRKNITVENDPAGYKKLGLELMKDE